MRFKTWVPIKEGEMQTATDVEKNDNGVDVFLHIEQGVAICRYEYQDELVAGGVMAVTKQRVDLFESLLAMAGVNCRINHIHSDGGPCPEIMQGIALLQVMKMSLENIQND